MPVDNELIEYRSQDLDEVLHDTGQFYWSKISEFRKNQNLLYNRTVPYLVSETEVQDIDNESDWIIAELKYKLMVGGE